MELLPSPATPPSHQTPAAREVFGILRRHRIFLAAMLAVGLAVGLAVASTRVPVYQGSALLLIENRRPDPTGVRPLDLAPTESQIGTAMELLRSRQLAQAVVDSLHLQLRVSEPASVPRRELFSRIEVSPTAAAAEYVLRREGDGRFRVEHAETERPLARVAVGQVLPVPGASLVLAPGAAEHDEIRLDLQSRASATRALIESLSVAQPGENVSMIRVSFEARDPELVQQVPNALTARFMQLRESVQKTEARSTVDFLRRQLDTLAVQLTAAEERLRGFREANRVIDPQAEASSQVQSVAQLQAERAALESERRALAGLLAEARTGAGPSAYRRMVAFPTLIRNEAATELLRSLAEVENQRTTLLSRRSDEDPDVQILTRRVRELEQQLQAVVTTYLQGLTNQVASTDAALAQYRGQMSSIPANEVQFARLSRQPRVLQSMYETLQTRLKEAEIAQAIEDPSVRVVDTADLPSEPVGPNSGLIAGASALLGLLVGLGIVFGREYADQSVHSRTDLRAAIGMPVLGLIPATGSRADRRRVLPWPRGLLPAGGGSGSRGVLPARRTATAAPLLKLGTSDAALLEDAFHRLHANLTFAKADAKILLFTSPLPGDGKSLTATNFAIALAQSGLKVLLVDADVRNPHVHGVFGTALSPGLSDLLGEEPVFEGVLRSVEVGRGKPLRYIAAGQPSSNPVQLLSSPVLRELLEGAAQEYDRIIIDSSPLNLFADAAVLSASVDGVVVVARSAVTPFDALVDAAEHLRRANARVLGAVLNGVDYEQDATYDRVYRWQSYAARYGAESKPSSPAGSLPAETHA